MADSNDDEQLDFAKSDARVLFSFNISDFQRIHTEYLSQGKMHGGIILAVQQRYLVGERIRRLQKLIAATAADEMRNHLEFLSGWG